MNAEPTSEVVVDTGVAETDESAGGEAVAETPDSAGTADKNGAVAPGEANPQTVDQPNAGSVEALQAQQEKRQQQLGDIQAWIKSIPVVSDLLEKPRVMWTQADEETVIQSLINEGKKTGATQEQASDRVKGIIAGLLMTKDYVLSEIGGNFEYGAKYSSANAFFDLVFHGAGRDSGGGASSNYSRNSAEGLQGRKLMTWEQFQENIKKEPHEFFKAIKDSAQDRERGLKRVPGWEVADSDLDAASSQDNDNPTVQAAREKVMKGFLNYLFARVGPEGDAWNAVQGILPEKMMKSTDQVFGIKVQEELEQYYRGTKNVRDLYTKGS